MAIKNIIAKGIGFTPGGIKYIITHGFDIGAPPFEFFGKIFINPEEVIFLSVNPEPVVLEISPDIEIEVS